MEEALFSWLLLLGVSIKMGWEGRGREEAVVQMPETFTALRQF